MDSASAHKGRCIVAFVCGIILSVMAALRLHRPRRELEALVQHLHSASVFLFANALIGAALYTIGNFQDFLDATQYALLTLMQYIAIGAALVTAVYLGFAVIQMVTFRRFRLRHVLYALIVTTLSGAIALAAGVLTTISVY